MPSPVVHSPGGAASGGLPTSAGSESAPEPDGETRPASSHPIDSPVFSHTIGRFFSQAERETFLIALASGYSRQEAMLASVGTIRFRQCTSTCLRCRRPPFLQAGYCCTLCPASHSQQCNTRLTQAATAAWEHEKNGSIGRSAASES